MALGVRLGAWREFGVKWGVFVVSENERYHFSGATLVGDRYEPNDICWPRYCAFTADEGLAIAPSKIAWLVNGKEKIVINGQFSHLASRRNHFEELSESYWSRDITSWKLLINELEQLKSHNKNAQEILSIIESRMDLCRQTADQIIESLRSLHPEPRDMELCIAGTQWFWYNNDNGLLVMGDGERQWGKVVFQKNLFLGLASPIHNGWAIQLTRTKRYLLRWDGHTVLAQKTAFPFGMWERQNQWTFWGSGNVILTPTGRAVIAPPANLLGINQKEALFYAPHLGGFLFIDEQGKHRREVLPKKYGDDYIDLYMGNQDLLILYCFRRHYYLYITNTIKKPLLRKRQAFMAFPTTTHYQVQVLKGNPDVFVFVFQPNTSKKWHIFLIDAHGKFWFFPSALDLSVDKNNLVVMQENGQVIVKRSDQQNDQADTPVVKIGLLADCAYVQLDEGVSYTGQMTRLPNRTRALWEHLRVAFDV